MVIPKGFSDFLASEVTENRKEHSLFHVIPVPMERSVSYGRGTDQGPFAILEASQQLEAWDGFSIPLDMGIHTVECVDCTGNTEEILSHIENSVNASLDCNAIPVILGGEHTVTLGALRALHSHYASRPLSPFGIIQIDAHADLRDEYEGDPLSHASVMRRAVDDLDLPLFQIGVRALCFEEVKFRKEKSISCIDARDIYLKGLNGLPRQLLPQDFPDNIYITIDVDGLDPSVIRATGTPVPGGIGWYDTIALLERCIYGRNVIGFDIVELAPVENDTASDFAAALLVYMVMGMVQRNYEKSGILNLDLIS
ncbi:Agmatinase [Desulfamplus magnetovallimortis]|uniref:Agmatinase n=1 Tax=Desulfamplus magnetovallimortis TaxID=1246637 RepID=A0A1W1HH02_9BACT|nr:agmatinase [Desulfamplus magnetovallimortis]SLM31777.1 Agmatinase [Desulfamplus magnetovallimortis]